MQYYQISQKVLHDAGLRNLFGVLQQRKTKNWKFSMILISQSVVLQRYIIRNQ